MGMYYVQISNCSITDDLDSVSVQVVEFAPCTEPMTPTS